MMWLRRSRTQPGQVIVETALTLLMYLMIVVALVEAGLAFASFGVLTFAVHDGARHAILPSTPSEAAVQTRVADTSTGMGVSIQTSDVTVAIKDFGGASKAFIARANGDRVRVSATYTYRPVSLWVFTGNVPFSPATEIMVE